MEVRNQRMPIASETNTGLSRWAWLLLPAFVATILVLGILDIRTIYGPPWSTLAINSLSFIGASLLSTTVAAQAYLRSASRVALSFGTGMLTLGLAGLASGYVLYLGDRNGGVAVHNSLVLLAGAIFLAGGFYAALARESAKPRKPRIVVLVAAYAASLVIVGVVTWLAATGSMPVFITPERTTPLRTAVLTATVSEFLFAAMIFAVLFRYTRVAFLRWYGLGLALVGVGLAAAALTLVGTPMAWACRFAQLLGQTYIVVGLLSLARHSLADSAGAALSRVFERLEEALQQSEQKFRSVLDNSRDVIYRLNVQTGLYEYISPSAERVMGFSAEELIAQDVKTALSMVHPDDLSAVRSAHARLEETGDGEIEYRQRTKSGDYRWLSNHLSLTRDDAGRPLYRNGILTDITERKEVEEAMLESEKRFRALVTASSDVVYRMSPDWSEMRHLVGRDFIADTETSDRTWLQKYIHPDDQSRVMAAIGKAIRTRSIFELEHRVLRVDGSLGWTFSRAIPLMGENGEIVEWFGAASDVTDRKRAEDAVRELEANKQEFYRRTIFAATEGKLKISERHEIEEAAGPALATWEIRSKENMSDAMGEAAGLAQGADMSEQKSYDFMGCIVEALANVVKHGAGGVMSLHRNGDRLFAVVSDSGPGIAAMALPDVALTKNYSTAGTLGMGFKLMMHFADIIYLATGPEGTMVAIEMEVHKAARSQQDRFGPRTITWV